MLEVTAPSQSEHYRTTVEYISEVVQRRIADVKLNAPWKYRHNTPKRGYGTLW